MVTGLSRSINKINYSVMVVPVLLNIVSIRQIKSFIVMNRILCAGQYFCKPASNYLRGALFIIFLNVCVYKGVTE